MMKTMLLLLATLAVIHASGVPIVAPVRPVVAAVAPVVAPVAPIVAPVAPVAYDYGTTILDGSIQQNRVTGYAGLAYSPIVGYRGFGPYYGNLGGYNRGFYGGYNGGFGGFGGFYPGNGLGGYFLKKR